MRAGADLVLLTGRGSFTPVYAHLVAAAERPPPRARVREAAARVLALKRAAAPERATPIPRGPDDANIGRDLQPRESTYTAAVDRAGGDGAADVRARHRAPARGRC